MTFPRITRAQIDDALTRTTPPPRRITRAEIDRALWRDSIDLHAAQGSLTALAYLHDTDPDRFRTRFRSLFPPTHEGGHP